MNQAIMKTFPLTLFIFIFSVFLFSFGAQDLSLGFKGDENFYLESAKEMFETGDVITPRYMGEERFEKPILFYWIILSSFKIFGINWFASRLPSIIFGTLCVLLIFAISNRLFEDKKIGLFAALFSTTTQLFYRYARLTVPDMTLVFFITLALYFFVRFYKNREDHKSAVLFFAAMAFAVLVKGPVGMIIPLLIVVIFCLIKKERPFGLGDVLMGIAIFCLIAGPWFCLIYKIHGETYLRHILGREILQRLGYGHTGLFLTGYFRGLFFYTRALIFNFLPYSLFIPLGIINGLTVLSKNRFSNRYGESEKGAHLFLILWIAVIFFFFTFVAEKRAWYLLPLSPPVSILTGVIFKKAILDKQFFSRPGFKIPYLMTLIAIILFATLLFFSDYISGEKKISIWKYMLIIVPVILVLGFHFKDRSFMPLSLVFSLALLHNAIAVLPSLDMSRNKMERAAMTIKSELKEGGRIGIGSHGIIPEELQVFFELPVENVKVTYRDDGTPDLYTAPRLIQFLKSRERIFCVIKRKDYDNFIPEKIKENLYTLDSYYVWKRRIRFDGELRAPFANVKSHSFREIFQNEIYVISNK